MKPAPTHPWRAFLPPQPPKRRWDDGLDTRRVRRSGRLR